MKKYDVAIMGVWTGCNYGSITTYYSLNQIIKSMGKSVVMIAPPTRKKSVKKPTHSSRFAKEHYNIADHCLLKDTAKLNELADTFVIGSDQVWNYGISRHFGKSFYLDFASEEKNKISYASSFGHKKDFTPDSEREAISKLLNRFNHVSVRESNGVKLCKSYKVRAKQVLDPVFLPDASLFDDLAAKSDRKEEQKYLLSYILDPTPIKREALLHLAKKLNLKLVNVLDGWSHHFDENKEKLNLENTMENVNVEDWLYYFKNSSFVVTDSCHGVSFSIIYQKPFIAIGNKNRGVSRFESLLKVFKLRRYYVENAVEIIDNDYLLKPIDYDKVDSILKKTRAKSLSWLEHALNRPHS